MSLEQIDGVVLKPGDRFVLLNQPDPGRDGIYAVKAGRWPSASIKKLKRKARKIRPSRYGVTQR